MENTENQKTNISGKLRKVAETHFKEQFKTRDGETYVTLKTENGGTINLSTKSQELREFLKYKYYELYRKALPAKHLSETIDCIEAKIKFESRCLEAAHRVGFKDNQVFFDLHNEYGDWIHVTKEGWSLNRNKPSEIKLIRSSNSLSITAPEITAKDKIYLLKEYLNLENDEDFLLILAFLISVFNVNAPQIILIFQGQQGCGKTSNTKILRKLIDPNKASIRSFTSNEDDLLIAANNSFLLAYDNLSGISNKMADALCRLSTGAGMGKRKLYTNFEEAIISIKRPIILNGIDDLSRRSDMADRSLILNLPTIKPTERKSESEIWVRFEEDFPKILGALMGILSEVLNVIPTIELHESPRMKDFAIWGSALGIVLGHPKDYFLSVYSNSIKNINISAIDNNPLLFHIIKELIENEDNTNSSSYEATSRELLKRITPFSGPKPRNIPKSEQGVGIQLRRLTPILNSLGVEVLHFRRNRGERVNQFIRSNAHKPLSESLFGEQLDLNL